MSDKNETWIKLYRSMLNWEWYKDNNTKILFLHLLLSVNYEPQRKRGVLIPAGSVDRTLEQLKTETGLSIQQLRTAIIKLKSTEEITVVKHPFFSVFSIVSWSQYQNYQQKKQHKNNNRLTEEQQQNNNLNKNNKEYKEYKENIGSDEQIVDDDDEPTLTRKEAEEYERIHGKPWEGWILG